MKINAHTGNVRNALEIIVEDIKLAKDKETVEIEANVRWGISRLKNKRGAYKEFISESKPNSDLLNVILNEIKQKSLTIVDTYIEKPKGANGKKEKAKKWYAVKIGKNVKDAIYENWDECKAVVDGYNSIYKSFYSLEEAKEYLGTIDVENELKKKEYAMKIKKESQEKAILNSMQKIVTVSLSDEMYKDLVKKSKETRLSLEHIIKFAISNYLY